MLGTYTLLEHTASKRDVHQESNAVPLGASLWALVSLIALTEYLTQLLGGRTDLVSSSRDTVSWWARRGGLRWLLIFMDEGRCFLPHPFKQ